MRFALVPAFLLLVVSFAWTGDRDKKDSKPAAAPQDYIHWAHSWTEALAEAKERNVPIQVAFHKDH